MNDNTIADVTAYMNEVGRRARAASRRAGRGDHEQKDDALAAIARELDARRATLAAENAEGPGGRADKGLDAALLDRLALTPKVVDSMIEGVRQVMALPDPVGEVFDMNFRPSGIQVGRMRVPLGVVGIIYESRPNVTVDAAVLCLKSGNATVLRGGSEAFHSNQAIAACVQRGPRGRRVCPPTRCRSSGPPTAPRSAP